MILKHSDYNANVDYLYISDTASWQLGQVAGCLSSSRGFEKTIQLTLAATVSLVISRLIADLAWMMANLPYERPIYVDRIILNK